MRKKFCYVGLITLIVLSNLLVGFAEETYTWEEKASFSLKRSYFGSVEIGGKIYIIGGSGDSNTPLSVVEEYNPTNNTWTFKAGLIKGRSFFDTATYNNKIYVFGGLGGPGNHLNTVEMYNPTTDTWVSRANMPVKRTNFKAITVNNKIYIFGGTNESGIVKQIDIYDPITNKWKTKANIPFGDRAAYSLAAVGSKIYVIGGRKDRKFDGAVDIYDTVSETWETASNLIPCTYTNGSFVYDNKIYTTVCETYLTTNILASLNLETDTWSYAPFSPFYNSCDAEMAVIENKLYVMGGQVSDIDGNITSGSTNVVSINLLRQNIISPANLTATPGNSQVTLNWSAVDGAESYNVKRSTTQGGPYTTIADNVTGTSYIDTNVTNGTTYYYVVTAVNADGESENSNEALATPFAPIVNRALLNITMQNSLIKEYDMAMTEVENFISWYNRSNGSKLYTINKYNNIGPFLNRKDNLVKDKILCFEVMEYENNN